MKKIKTGIIGCGHFGQKRLKACLKLSQYLAIKALVDPNPEIKKIAQKNKIGYYANYQKLLKNTQIDLVIISTPNIFHAPIAIECLKRNIHVLCEKPIATNSHDATKIVRAAQKSSALIKLGSNHAFFPTIKKVQQLLKKEKVGKILSFRGMIGTNGELSKNSWFWDKKIAGGGTMIDNGSHLLTLIQMTMGNFSHCTGRTSNIFWGKSKVEDYCTAILTNKNNQQALITSSWTQWANYLHLELIGETGQIEVKMGSKDTTTLYLRNNKIKPKVWNFSNSPHTSYQDEIKYFLNCINQNDQPYPNAMDGLKIIKTIEAIYRSNSSKKWEKI